MSAIVEGARLLARPRGVPVGVVRALGTTNAVVAFEDGTEMAVPLKALEAGGRADGPVALLRPDADGALRGAVSSREPQWTEPPAASVLERCYAVPGADNSAIADMLEPAFVAQGFAGVGVSGERFAVAYGHPQAPDFVLTIEDLVRLVRLRVYDGSRVRLLYVDSEWEPLIQGILANVEGVLDEESARAMAAEGEVEARVRMAQAREAALEERGRKRTETEERRRREAEREVEERRARLRAEAMDVVSGTTDDGYPTAMLPGKKLPKKKIIAALRELIATTPNLEGVRLDVGTGRGWPWELTLECKEWALGIALDRFDPDDIGSGFSVDYTWPRRTEPRSWRDSAEVDTWQVALVESALRDVYALLEPEDIGLEV
jgi:hypothetical protein